MEKKIRKTLLHGWHMSMGAKMADFGGYEMPLWYSSAKKEHLAPLTGCGMFDTSHMASVMVKGPGAFDLLQLGFTKDLNRAVGISPKPLFPGRCVYGAFLKENGWIIDDAIIFMLEENRYMVVVNAGMGGVLAEHLNGLKDQRDVEIENLEDNLGKFDVQGPLSAKVLKKVLADPEKVFEKMPYFSFKGDFDLLSSTGSEVKLTSGVPILLSRTGYTGEFGFEIFVNPDSFVETWETIIKAGEEYGVIPCGLAARDSLRAGAVLPLSHQDIGDWPFINNPWPFALPFGEDGKSFTKNFVGDKALKNPEPLEYTYPFVGYDVRKVSLPAKVFLNDKEIGTVLTCATDMAMGRHNGEPTGIGSHDKPEGFKAKGLSCGFIKVAEELSNRDVVEIRDGKRKLKVSVQKDIRPGRTARKPIKSML